MSKVSDCCGAAPRGNGDSDTEDYGICPECKEHCEYVEEDEEDEEDVHFHVMPYSVRKDEFDNRIDE